MKFTELPVIITDKNGIIIKINEAAHIICAALCIGDDITSVISKDHLDAYHRGLFSGLPSFTLPSSLSGCRECLFDLTRSDSHGIFTVYPKADREASFTVDYDDIAKEFEAAASESGFYAKRRFAMLYDTLISKNTVFSANRRKALFSLKPLLDRFVNSILPRHLYFNSEIIYTEDTSVSDKSIVFAEPYSLYLLLCAVISLCGHISNGAVSLSVSDRKDKVTLSFSCALRDKALYSAPASFGTRAADLLYAESISKVCGYELLFEEPPSHDKMTVTVSLSCSNYYPSYLKADTGSAFTIDSAALSVDYPVSTEK